MNYHIEAGPVRDGFAEEEPIEPALPVIDAHHHIRDPKGGMRYLVPEFARDIYTGHRVLATVVIEEASMYRREGPVPFRPVGETEFLNGVSAMFASGRYGPALAGAGIVAFANLTLGDAVAPVLDAHIEAGRGRVKGIRVSAHWHKDFTPALITARHATLGLVTPPHMLMDETFRKGIACLTARDLSYDVSVFHTQIPELADLADKFPSTRIVAGHFAIPLGWGPYRGKHKEVFDDWRRELGKLALRPNVHIKMSGVRWAAIPVEGHRTSETGEFETAPSSAALAKAWRPYIETCVELFGPDRCMFGTNFNSERVVCAYSTMWNAYKLATADYSADERAALFTGTAARFYRLPAPAQLDGRWREIEAEARTS